jgi:plasmid stabilization system protein ParE
MKPIIFLPEAEEEMVEAARFYETQTSGLGADFLLEIRRATEGISKNPRAGRVLRGKVRRRLVRRFPYGLLYHVDPNEIVVVAVMHLRRRPGYWRGRR